MRDRKASSFSCSMPSALAMWNRASTISSSTGHCWSRGPAQARKLLRIGLVTRDVLTGEIVEPRNVARLFRRKIEDLAERGNLGFGYDAVRLGHLGRKRDDRHGEGNLAARFRVALECSAYRLDHPGQHTARRVADSAQQTVPTTMLSVHRRNRISCCSMTKSRSKKQDAQPFRRIKLYSRSVPNN